MEFDDILIKAEGVNKQFGHRPVLRDINLEVRRGDKLVMLGSNGAGKSTLVRILLGIERPTSGTVWRRGQIGYVPDFNPKFDFETVGDLAAFLDVDDYGPFEEFGIKKFLTRRLKTLSKGELRRVLIAIAMAKGKDLLILDEPYNGLDPDGRRVLRNVLRGIDSYIFVTHLIEEIPQNANRLIFIEKGKIVIDAKKGVRVYAHEGPNPPARAYALGRNIWIAKENIGKLIF